MLLPAAALLGAPVLSFSFPTDTVGLSIMDKDMVQRMYKIYRASESFKTYPCTFEDFYVLSQEGDMKQKAKDAFMSQFQDEYTLGIRSLYWGFAQQRVLNKFSETKVKRSGGCLVATADSQPRDLLTTFSNQRFFLAIHDPKSTVLDACRYAMLPLQPLGGQVATMPGIRTHGYNADQVIPADSVHIGDFASDGRLVSAFVGPMQGANVREDALGHYARNVHFDDKAATEAIDYPVQFMRKAVKYGNARVVMIYVETFRAYVVGLEAVRDIARGEEIIYPRWPHRQAHLARHHWWAVPYLTNFGRDILDVNSSEATEVSETALGELIKRLPIPSSLSSQTAEISQVAAEYRELFVSRRLRSASVEIPMSKSTP
jgi:hypothetical protein